MILPTPKASWAVLRMPNEAISLVRRTKEQLPILGALDQVMDLNASATNRVKGHCCKPRVDDGSKINRCCHFKTLSNHNDATSLVLKMRQQGRAETSKSDSVSANYRLECHLRVLAYSFP